MRSFARTLLIATILVGAGSIPQNGLAAAEAPVRAHDAIQALTPVAACPAGDLSCIVRGLWVESKAKSLIRTRTTSAGVEKTFFITGALNGGESRRYALRFTQQRWDYFAATNHSGPIAQYGPPTDLTVLTDQGSLRIETPELRADRIPNLVVVDARHWRVLARQYTETGDDCPDLSFLTRKRTRGLWDDGGQRCVARPLTEKGALTKGTGCVRPRKGDCSIPRTFAPAPMTIDQLNATVRDMRILRLWENTTGEFGGSGWTVESYRPPDKNLVVIIGHCTDCGD
jgi:hypothetical protein